MPQAPQSNASTSADAAKAYFGTTEISAPDRIPPQKAPTRVGEAQVVEEPTRQGPDQGSFLDLVLVGRNLHNDIAAANTRAKEIPYELRDRHATLIASLEPAYPIFLHLRAHKEAFRELLKHPHYADQAAARKRKPSPDKPALLAVHFLLRPKTINDAKDASDYATFLEWAEDHKIAPCDFAEDLADVSLREAKQFVSGKRKRGKAEATKKDTPNASDVVDIGASDADQTNGATLAETAAKPPAILRITIAEGTDAAASAEFTVGARVLDDLLGQLSNRTDDQSFEDFVLALINRLTEPKTTVGAESPAA